MTANHSNDWLDIPLDLSGKTVWIAGHKGLVGSALMRRLKNEDCTCLTSDIDLRIQQDVQAWMAHHRPDIVIIAAAKVGGIGANQNAPAEFITDNLMIQSNIIQGAHAHHVQKLLFLGSSCIYPKHANQPISEDALMSGALEPSNDAYAIAKIAGLKMCAAYRSQYGCDFIAAMPCNLYGPGDKFDKDNSHVIPAIIMKMQDAKNKGDNALTLWGSGTALREFLYIDDLADGLVFLLKHYSSAQPINIGSGQEISIADLADRITALTGFQGEIVWDTSKSDGTPRKLLDNTKINAAGWSAKTNLESGLQSTYNWYL